MKFRSLLRNDRGIGVGAIIGIVALLAVLGAVIASSFGGGSSNTASEQDKLNASAILMQSGSLKDGTDLLIAQNSEADVSEINLDSTWNPGGNAYGIFNATNGTVEYTVPPKAALTAASTAEWTILADTAATPIDFDGNGNNDFAIQVQTVVDPVCEAINEALGLGATLTPTTTGRVAYCVSGVYSKALDIR